MRKSQCNKKCACGNLMIKNGKTKDDRQKYICKKCRKVETDKVAYTVDRNSYKLLKLLYNIINQPINTPKKLQELFSGNIIEKFELKNTYFSFLKDEKSDVADVEIIYKNLRLVITMDDDNNLIIYKLPSIKKDNDADKTYKILAKKNFKISPANNSNYYLFKNIKRKRKHHA